jgi:hypothetical protein
MYGGAQLTGYPVYKKEKSEARADPKDETNVNVRPNTMRV